jgi:hypothetical protein
MKKQLLIVLVLLSLVTALVGVAAAPMRGGTATLLGVGFVRGRVVFTFKVTGDYSAEDLVGRMVVDGQSYKLQCRKVNFETVKCTSTQKAQNNEEILYWGGAAYTAEVHDASDASFCYGVFDWNPEGGWKDYGPHCQDGPAQYEDSLLWDNPDWGTTTYWFEPYGPACSGLSGDAYYYDEC